ncbi:MAG: molybdopterin cofactor-binding domain-containing protein, partial [Elusimicrobiota bacterium]
PHAHALIKNIDTSKAENLEGVELVVTHKNAPDTLYNTAGQGYPEPSPYDRRLIDKKVRFVGDRVAVVAAVDEKTAQKAMDLIEVEYKKFEPVFTMKQATAENAPQVHTENDCTSQFDIGTDLKNNIAASNSGGIGDLKQGLGEADEVVEREYESARVQCSPLEPHLAYTEVINDRLIVHTPTQVPFHVRRLLSRILDVNESKIRVIKEKIGGGFGSKQDMVLEDIPAWVSWITGKPAYLRYTREEEFITRPRYKMKIKVKMGAKKDGTLTAIDMNLKAEAGAYGPHCLTVPMNACSKSLPIFKCDNSFFNVQVYYTNNVISGAYQGYGAPQGSYALQLAAAELADKLGIDHVKLLEKNGVKKGDRLEILKQLGEGQEGIAQVVSSSGIHQALKEGKQMINWKESPRSDNPNILTGKGVSIIQQGSGLPGIDAGNATVKMLGDGNFMVLFGGTDLGTGLDTVAAKVAAETLKVDLNQVAVTAADTDTTPFDVGSYASSGTYFSGMSVYNAAKDMKRLILEKASEMMEVNIDELRLEKPGKVVGGGKEKSFLEIARKTQSGTGSGQLISKGSFTTDEAPIPYAAHFVQVSVNKNTGEINIDKYYALHDSGTPINPKLARGQIYGGVLKTIGHSIYEELKFDENGRCINPNFLDYKIPMISELPDDFKAKLVYTDDHLGPYGAKSIGEVVANGAAPAIADAIHDATGIWLRSWPFSPEKILSLLQKKKSIGD